MCVGGGGDAIGIEPTQCVREWGGGRWGGGGMEGVCDAASLFKADRVSSQQTLIISHRAIQLNLYKAH